MLNKPDYSTEFVAKLVDVPVDALKNWELCGCLWPTGMPKPGQKRWRLIDIYRAATFVHLKNLGVNTNVATEISQRANLFHREELTVGDMPVHLRVWPQLIIQWAHDRAVELELSHG